ncbi:MAG: class I SAM-dependent methyltransferase [Spirochaetaceae bacterium]|jgi:2-polyprenyl-3-methyl-5-hydroxy-6-metoxy-1,4-benzoquinol methylase|nr:class I SAM-dependent methyltransferase [Spirochaetaceae bacterium]
MRHGAILVAAAHGAGRGGGHLVRSAALVRALRDQGRDAWLYTEGSAVPGARAPGDVPADIMLCDEAEIARRAWDWIILDNFRTSPQTAIRWARWGPLIGIDEGGPYRSRFDFLADFLPVLPARHRPNLSSFALTRAPEKRRAPPFALPRGPLRVLVTFGAEDPARLTVPVSRALASARPALEITALFGSLNTAAPGKDALRPAGVTVWEAACGVRDRFADFDLVITHFGLTAFEALFAGTPVLLVSPTAYHRRLARRAGFCEAGTGKSAAGRLGKLLFRRDGPDRVFLEALSRRSAALAEKYGLDGGTGRPRTVPEITGDFAGREPLVFTRCPVCGRGERLSHRVVARFPGRTYRRCACCGIVYQNRLNPPPVEYAKAYFFDAYRAQYGKTYLEDFPALKEMGRERLSRIRAALRSTGKAGDDARLLDIGCAYGPFLDAAREAGFVPEGVEPAASAASWVRATLGIPVHEGLFPAATAGFPPERFTAVTLWYVLEHFRDPAAVLAEIRRLLKPGGVLAFSTPSLTGISGRVSRVKFLEQSPADHFTVWDVRRTGKILAGAGFRLRNIRITGHHPERFPLPGTGNGRRGAVYRAGLAISRVFRLGDTFEAYAVKIED